MLSNNVFQLDNFKNSVPFAAASQPTILPNVWFFVTATLSGTSGGTIYVNGALSGGNSGMQLPNGVNRTSKFIGKSNLQDQALVNMVLQDLRIYNRSLSQREIATLMRSYPCKGFVFWINCTCLLCKHFFVDVKIILWYCRLCQKNWNF